MKKKKTIKLLFTLAAVAIFGAVLVFSAFAEIYTGECGENVTYKLDTETGVLEISGTGEMTNYSSSSSVPWYSNRSYVKTVKISDGVTSIGSWAFYYCSSLGSIVIPDSVTSIGYAAFEYCSSLGSIEIPDSVTSIGNYAFLDCSSLASIEIPDSVTSIGNSAFSSCSSLGSIVIPDSVTSIGELAFYSCSSLTAIKVDENNKYFCDVNGVLFTKDIGTLIQYPSGNDATSYSIPDSVTSIGDYAFLECSSLQSIVIPDSITSIGEGAFRNCRSLKNLYISDLESWLNVKLSDYDCHPIYSAGGNLYIDGVLATDIEIPDTVSSIGNYTFYNCDSITSVILPDSVTSIGDSAFCNCSNLANITIPDSVTYIGSGVLDNTAYFNDKSNWSDNIFLYNGNHLINTKYDRGYYKTESYRIRPGTITVACYLFNWKCEFETVYIPSSVKNIGDDVFRRSRYPSYLKEIKVEEGNERYYDINGVLFDRQENSFIYPEQCQLTEFIVPEGITKVDKSIQGNQYLEKIIIPKSVEDIDFSYFEECSSLKHIDISDSNSNYCDIDGVVYTKDKKTLIKYPCGGFETYEIPNSVTSIVDYAFSHCRNLTSITIPDSVTSIGDGVFYYCSSLISVTIPDSVTSIGDDAFYYCGSLTNVTIGDSVTSIGDGVFYYCSSLISVTIPDSVTSIGERAFMYCSSLTSVTIGDRVTSIGEWAFMYCSSLTAIEVDENNKYYLDVDGVLFTEDMNTLIQYPIGNKATSYSIPDSITSIGDFAFDNCSSLASIVIPDSVTSIGNGAFDSCGSLKSVAIPDSVTSIGGSAFYECSSLKSVAIPDSVTSIGGWAFSSCSSLTSVTIGDSVTSIGAEAFSSCSSLTSVTIGDSVTSIGSYAFAGCSSLESVTIPDSVTSIGERAFMYCSNLTSVTFKTKNATIGPSAFNNCSNLETIYLYRNSTADEFFSGEEYTKIYLDDIKFGDVSDDSVVNTKDMMLLAKSLCGFDIEIDKTAADLNLDGIFDIKDLILLAQYLAGWDVTLE